MNIIQDEMMASEEGSNSVMVAEKDKGKIQPLAGLILYSKEIIAAVIVGVIITVSSAVILEYIYPENENIANADVSQNSTHMNTVEPSHREYVIRAALANVYSALLPIKTHINVYFQTMGTFPLGKEVDISKYDLDELKYVSSSFLTEEGGFGVNLTEEFGQKKSLVLTPSSSRNGAFIKWQCVTNVDEKYLGLPQSRFCDFKANLD